MYGGVIGVCLCRMRRRLCLYVGAVGSARYLIIYYALLAPGVDPATAEALPTVEAWAAWHRVFAIMSIAAVLEFATRQMRTLATEGSSETWRRRQLETEFGRLCRRTS